jgi:alpha-N-arabinofuranosidase
LNTRNRKSAVLIALFISIASLTSIHAKAAQEATIEVAADKPGPAISPTLYGLMTEEINHSYDGGLYGELIRNRDFKEADKKDPTKPAWWSAYPGRGPFTSSLTLDRQEPVNATGLPVSLKVEVKEVSNTSGASDDTFRSRSIPAPCSMLPVFNSAGVVTSGYWGIPARRSVRYTASFYARGEKGFVGPLMLDISGSDEEWHSLIPKPGPIYIDEKWKKYTVVVEGDLDLQRPVAGEFSITSKKPGTFWLSQVSLFPATYKNRPNGNRIDLMEKMADMHPAFLRFPGGNYLEGDTIAERFDWKKTIGPIEDRPGHRCCWGYPSSDGFGLTEFIHWCEDLNMEPVLAVYAGYSLKGQHVEKPEELKPFIQDALDEIEFVSGPTDTTWGRKRAELGFPPVKLRYVEIGNEDWFDRSRSYDSRFAQFYDAIKAKYPELQLIATTKVTSRRPDVVDDHYYRSAAEMQRDVHHYDKISRTGPKIFVGEWATTEGRPTPTLNAALGDAAWMTGMERNSDLIVMSCYAPLFVNVNPGASEWNTNLIGYNALSSYGSPAYYAQVMFAQNRGDVVLPVKIDAAKIPPLTVNPRPRRGRPASSPVSVDPLYATASRDKASGDVILKLVNIIDEPVDAKINISGGEKIAAEAKAIVLTGERLDQNSVAEPKKVAPHEETISNAGPAFTHTLPARSITVLRLKAG